MGVASQHAQVLVTGNTRNFHDVETALEETCGSFMPKVVEAEILDPRSTHGAYEGAFDGFSRQTGKDLTMKAAGEGAQNLDGGCRQRHGPGFTVLGVRQVDGAPIEV